ncbi:hypothetical protein ACM66B_001334 [Microbotryomycetes sp. NB124-2]
MWPRARHATTRIASRTEYRQLASGATSNAARCSCGARLPSANPSKGKQVSRRLLPFAEQLHTTTRFSVQPLASTSSSRQDDAALVRQPASSPSSASEKTLKDLNNALKSGSRTQLHATLSQLSSDARSQLDRDTFDRLFKALCYDQSLDAPVWKMTRISKTWNAVKQLRELASERRWQLSPEQLRVCFRTGAHWEHERHKRTRNSKMEVAELDWATPEREQQRRQYLHALSETVLELDRSATIDARRDADMMEMYAAALLARGDDVQEALRILYQAFELDTPSSERHSGHIDDPIAHAPSSPSSIFIPFLFRLDHQRAFLHLHRMLDHGRLPTASSLRTTLLEQQLSDDSDAAYAEARRILDDACASSSTASAQLDRMYEQRLSRIADEEEIQKRPMLSFLRWLGIRRAPASAEDVTHEQWTLLAFRLWRAFYGPSDWHEPLSPQGDRLLDELVVRACALAVDPSGSNERPPALLRTAVDSSLQYMSTPQLASRARLLLDTAALFNDLSPAKQLYAQLKQRLSPSHSFMWHAKSRSTLSKLVLSTLSADAFDDPRAPMFAPDAANFLIELYLDWTAAGLQFPQGLWRHLWLALGDLGDVDQLNRVVKDFEETGRGQVTSRIIDFVIQSSARTPGQHGKTLELVKFFRTRSNTWFARNQDASVWTAYYDDSFNTATKLSINHATRVSLSSYEAVLRQLALAKDRDRTLDAINLFRNLIQDDFEPRTDTFNALLMNQVLKQRLRLEDVVDNSRAVYDAMVERKCRPDRVTLSLVVHGLLRLVNGDFVTVTDAMAEGGQQIEPGQRTNEESSSTIKTTTYLEAALKAFNASIDRHLLISGPQTALLIYSLGSVDAQRFEDAKLVAEQWWNQVVSVEQKLNQVRDEIKLGSNGGMSRRRPRSFENGEDAATSEDVAKTVPKRRTDQLARDVERAHKTLQREIKAVERAQQDVLQLERDLVVADQLGDDEMLSNLRETHSDNVRRVFRYRFALVDELTTVLQR